MPSPLSVVIPTFNAEADLSGCLDALAMGLTEGLIREVIVVDGGSSDHSITLAYKWGARVIAASGKGRGRQLRTGGINAKGDWFLFLHADTQLSEGWPTEIRAHLNQFPEQAGAFKLQYRSNSKDARWLEKRANTRSKLFGLPYGDQGLLISRKQYEQLGGYSDFPLMEDVDLVRRIGKQQLRILDCHAMTSAEKYERDGWKKRARANAFLLLRYYLGASPQKLAQNYS